MEKIDLRDVTFLILIRLDSVDRLENVVLVTSLLAKYFDTNIVVREADDHCNGFLRSLLHRNIAYEYIEDKDPVLYKTRHFNSMSERVATPYLSIWDADVVPDKQTVLSVVERLRRGMADAALPYNHTCMDVTGGLRKYYMRKKDFRILPRNKDKMDVLYPHSLVGGAVFVRKDKYELVGKENEAHYGWGNDDFDRFTRFIKFGLKIHTEDTVLYHLSHPRGNNSQYGSLLKKQRSSAEVKKVSGLRDRKSIYTITEDPDYLKE